MTVDQWGALVVSSLVFVALLGQPVVNALKTLNVKKHFELTGFNIFAAFLILSLTWAVVKAIDYFDFARFKDPWSIEAFGQTGDFFGGILNPTFALISIILLLLTYRQTLRTSQLEHERVEREEIRSVINDTKITIENLKNKRDFRLLLDINDETNSLVLFSIADCGNKENVYMHLSRNVLQFLIDRSHTLLSDPIELELLNQNYLPLNAYKLNRIRLARIRSLTFAIIDLSIQYMKAQKSAPLKELMLTDSLNFLEKSYEHLILTDDEFFFYHGEVSNLQTNSRL